MSALRERCDYLLLTHRLYQDGEVKVGGLDRTKEHLLRSGKTVAILENPLTTYGPEYAGGFVSRLSLLEGTKRRTLSEFSVWPKNHPWRWFREPGRSCNEVRQHLEPGFSCISGDPLSGIAAISLKQAGVARSAVLHCTDFATRRFGNPLLNVAYLHICSKNIAGSDLVLCVSRRMKEHFEKWRPSGSYMFFPNTPDMNSLPRTEIADRDFTRLVMLGTSIGGMNHEMLVSGIAVLAEKGVDIRLDVLGGGGGEQVIRRLAEEKGVSERVKTMGFVPRDEALRMVSTSLAGIALYNESEPFNYFRDSIKIREYAGCGVPVISDKSTGTATEAQEAGAGICVSTTGEFVGAVEKILDRTVYERMVKNIADWAELNDKRLYLESLMERMDSCVE